MIFTWNWTLNIFSPKLVDLSELWNAILFSEIYPLIAAADSVDCFLCKWFCMNDVFCHDNKFGRNSFRQVQQPNKPRLRNQTCWTSLHLCDIGLNGCESTATLHSPHPNKCFSIPSIYNVYVLQSKHAFVISVTEKKHTIPSGRFDPWTRCDK